MQITHARPAARRRPALAAVAALVALATAACVPPTEPGPGSSTTTTQAPAGPTLTVTPTPNGVAVGSTVTVTGSGYDPTGNLGTRPPFAGQPAGVYVVFGRFAPNWRPSQGALPDSRQIISQVWALPRAAYDVLNPLGTNPEIVLLKADGTFTASLTLTSAGGTGSYGIATYAGSGAVNAAEEQLVPVTFLPPA